MWGFNKKSSPRKVIFSLSEGEIRLFHVDNSSGNLSVLNSAVITYEVISDLEEICATWLKKVNAKGVDCFWLLSRQLYKTINLVPPKVAKSELDSSIKWLVKDQVEQPLEQLIVCHYQPFTDPNDSEKLTAVIAQRSFIETLIEVTDAIGLNLVKIDISELTPRNSLSKQLQDNQIVGLIEQDKRGLIYNFYIGQALAFTRHIKGRFFPKLSSEFSLESDQQEQTDQFLLETQRTLDYCVSQIFRRPVNGLIIDAAQSNDAKLIESIEQVTEISVTQVGLKESDTNNHEESDAIELTIAETGILSPSLADQQVNFYLPEYQPQPLEFGFKYASLVAAISCVGFLFYGIAQTQEISALKLQLDVEKLTLSKTQEELQQLNRSLGKGNPIADLNNKISNKQKELNATQRLLAKVQQKNPEKPVSYSKILEALSNQSADSLWLTQIDLYPRTIALSGKTTKAESIPIYIENMSQSELLNSRFDGLNIERDTEDSRIINFQLTNGSYQNAQ